MITKTKTITEIDRTTIARPQRTFNRHMAVRWINAILIERAGHDVDRDWILLDKDHNFVYMLDFDPDDAFKARLRAETPVRFYSRGI